MTGNKSWLQNSSSGFTNIFLGCGDGISSDNTLNLLFLRDGAMYLVII
jgi:hypothetical protein